MESYAEAGDWHHRELAASQLLRVSELLHTTDTSDDASTPRDKVVTVVTTGSAVHAASGAVKDLITTRLGGRQARLETQAQSSRRCTGRLKIAAFVISGLLVGGASVLAPVKVAAPTLASDRICCCRRMRRLS